MKVAARIRFALIAVILAAVYYFLLGYLIGWMSTYQRPGWWVGVFSTKRVSAITWLVTLHTISVLSAALPIGIAAVLIARKAAVQLGLVSASLATVAGVVPSLRFTIWPVVWDSYLVFFVTDQIKFIVAVPFIAWVLRSASSNNRIGRSRGAASARIPGGRG